MYGPVPNWMGGKDASGVHRGFASVACPWVSSRAPPPWFPLPAPPISPRPMATSAYVLLHQPDTTATVIPSIFGVDQSKLLSKLPKTEKPPKVGDTKIFFDTPESKVTALVSLGDKFASKQSNEQRELIRRAVGSAVKEICNLDGVNRAEVDTSTDPQAAGKHPPRYPRPFKHGVLITYLIPLAVGAHLARYKFTLKTSPPSRFDPNLGEPIPESLSLEALNPSKEWDIGVKYAEAQNFARTVRISHRSPWFPLLQPITVDGTPFQYHHTYGANFYLQSHSQDAQVLLDILRSRQRYIQGDSECRDHR